MKRIKILVSIVTIVCMLLSLSSVAFAEELSSAEPKATEAAKTAVPLPEGEKLAEITIDGAVAPISEELVPDESTEVTLNPTTSDITTDMNSVQTKIDAKKYNALHNINRPKALASSALYGSVTDAIATEGEIQLYGIFSLAQNQILQVGLVCPTNQDLDYDLYIAEYNNDGTLGDLVSGSEYTTYFNVDKTIDEGADYTNTAASTKNYVVLVYAKKGGNASFPYTLYYAIDAAGNYNTGEHDQNEPLRDVKCRQLCERCCPQLACRRGLVCN